MGFMDGMARALNLDKDEHGYGSFPRGAHGESLRGDKPEHLGLITGMAYNTNDKTGKVEGPLHSVSVADDKFGSRATHHYFNGDGRGNPKGGWRHAATTVSHSDTDHEHLNGTGKVSKAMSDKLDKIGVQHMTDKYRFTQKIKDL